jgi:predicted DNA-binding transcriptional regulator
MNELVLWILMSYGMTIILVWGSIFNEPRQILKNIASQKQPIKSDIAQFLSDLVSCVLCTSTWVGFFYSMSVYSPAHEIFEINKNISWFCDGMFTAGSVWALNSVIEWFEENRPNNN